jgi:hypothetical protein
VLAKTVQVKVVPATDVGVDRIDTLVVVPEQIDCAAAVAVGTGLTVTT